jgi:hypothetical protein
MILKSLILFLSLITLLQVNGDEASVTTLDELSGLQISSSPSSVTSNLFLDILLSFDPTNLPEGIINK